LLYLLFSAPRTGVLVASLPHQQCSAYSLRSYCCAVFDILRSLCSLRLFAPLISCSLNYRCALISLLLRAKALRTTYSSLRSSYIDCSLSCASLCCNALRAIICIVLLAALTILLLVVLRTPIDRATHSVFIRYAHMFLVYRCRSISRTIFATLVITPQSLCSCCAHYRYAPVLARSYSLRSYYRYVLRSLSYRCAHTSLATSHSLRSTHSCLHSLRSL
jgi:hypothetical protein